MERFSCRAECLWSVETYLEVFGHSGLELCFTPVITSPLLFWARQPNGQHQLESSIPQRAPRARYDFAWRGFRCDRSAL